jgi:hypothetical protein
MDDPTAAEATAILAARGLIRDAHTERVRRHIPARSMAIRDRCARDKPARRHVGGWDFGRHPQDGSNLPYGIAWVGAGGIREHTTAYLVPPWEPRRSQDAPWYEWNIFPDQFRTQLKEFASNAVLRENCNVRSKMFYDRIWACVRDSIVSDLNLYNAKHVNFYLYGVVRETRWWCEAGRHRGGWCESDSFRVSNNWTRSPSLAHVPQRQVFVGVRTAPPARFIPAIADVRTTISTMVVPAIVDVPTTTLAIVVPAVTDVEVAPPDEAMPDVPIVTQPRGGNKISDTMPKAGATYVREPSLTIQPQTSGVQDPAASARPITGVRHSGTMGPSSGFKTLHHRRRRHDRSASTSEPSTLAMMPPPVPARGQDLRHRPRQRLNQTPTPDSEAPDAAEDSSGAKYDERHKGVSTMTRMTKMTRRA